MRHHSDRPVGWAPPLAPRAEDDARAHGWTRRASATLAPMIGVTLCVAAAAALSSGSGGPAGVTGLVVFAIGIALAVVPNAWMHASAERTSEAR
jgi:hypothetical protein